MSKKRSVLFIGILILPAFLCAPPARADLYWETESVWTNMPHRHNGTSVQKYYFTSKASRLELSGGKAFILNYDTMELYSLDTKKKTCTELNLANLPQLVDNPSPRNKKLDKVLGSVFGLQVTPTDEMRTIEGYRCRRYNIRLAILIGEYWVSEEVGGYQELKELGARVESVAERSPMLRQMDVGSVVERLGGFPVCTVNHVMGGTITSTLKRVERKSLDPRLFVVPKGYKIKKSKWAGGPETEEDVLVSFR